MAGKGFAAGPREYRPVLLRPAPALFRFPLPRPLFVRLLFSLLVLATGLAVPCTADAQAAPKVTLSGYIRDAASGETLIGATVSIPDARRSIQTNTYGFYSLTVDSGRYAVSITYLGYRSFTDTLDLSTSRTLDAALVAGSDEPVASSPTATSGGSGGEKTIGEVEVRNTRRDQNVRSTDVGVLTLTPDRARTLPVIFGEVDLLKTLQLMPGVQSSGEGNSGFYVRGGGPDQNLILLDDAVVYNSGHLFGFFSVFNSDALKNVTLTKGGIPAQYGGRLSSVVDVQMKEGNNKEYHAEGGIGLIASRLTVEGPIKKEKGSFMLSGRRTYIDVLTRPFVNPESAFAGSGYYFYDANLKANYTLGRRDRVYASGYFGRDVFTFRSSNESFRANIPWGNATGTVRWNHLFSDRVFLNTTAIFNDYQFAFEGGQNTFEVKLASAIRDYGAKTDLDYYAPFGHHFKTGLAYTYHRFSPNQVSGRSGETEFRPNNAFVKWGHEAAVYLQDEFEPTPWLRINAGIRYSFFGQVGPYTSYVENFAGDAVDSTVYGRGELVKSYGGPEPRLNMRFALSPSASIKASAMRSLQYLHLVTNNGSTLPTDVWVPSTRLVEPQKAWQYTLGYYQNFLGNALETSVEVYYKSLRNQVEYREGYLPNTLEDIERSFVFGKGEAYGAEFFINKTRGKFTGWIGYTLAWSWRTFADLNAGERYPSRYDRRHDLSIVASYAMNKKWTFSSVFVYGSGNAITLPTSFYFIDGQLVQQFSKLNDYRLFPYHRLDLSAVWKPGADKPAKRLQSSWAFSVYNVYSRMNPYFLYVDTQGAVGQGIDVKVKQVSIFPILPSITWNFRI